MKTKEAAVIIREHHLPMVMQLDIMVRTICSD
jgi:hypothetical protein